MSYRRVPFVKGVRFQTETINAIETRLATFLSQWRSAHTDQHALDFLDDEDNEILHGLDALSYHDRHKVRARAKRLAECRKQRSGLAHLRPEQLAMLELCRSGVALRGPSNVHAVDELVGALTAEMPWMTTAIDPIWRDARARVDQGSGFGFKPLLLVGPPGIGKTHLLRMIAELSGTPYITLDASAAGDGFSIAGSQRTWSNASPGRPVSCILESGCGNPMIFVDEIDKAGITHSNKGTTTSAWHALLGLLEPVSAAAWNCPFYGVTFDMSHINWVLAANSVHNIPTPLLSRCRVVHLGPISRPQLLELTSREVARRDLDPDIVQDVAHVLDLIPEGHAQLNIRMMHRVIEAVSDIYMRSELH